MQNTPTGLLVERAVAAELAANEFIPINLQMVKMKEFVGAIYEAKGDETLPQIEESDKQTIKELFGQRMESTAHIRFFTSKEDCQYCEDTLDILNQLAELSDKIDLQVLDKDADSDKAGKLGVNMYPAIVFVDDDENDTGVHFYGIPSGYEFSTLIEDIIDVANNHTDLSPETIDVLKQIDEDVTLSVFITPTWPYCPRAVRVAHHMAMINPHIKGEMIEAMEFPDLSNKHNVMGVPKTVINDGKAEQEGAVPEEVILEKIQASLQ